MLAFSYLLAEKISCLAELSMKIFLYKPWGLAKNKKEKKNFK